MRRGPRPENSGSVPTFTAQPPAERHCHPDRSGGICPNGAVPREEPWVHCTALATVKGLRPAARVDVAEHVFETLFMAKSRKTKRKQQANRRKRNRGGIRATVHTHTSGFRILQSGRSIVYDMSQMTDAARNALQEGYRDYARALPQLVAEDGRSIKEIVSAIPTLPALCSLSALTYLINPDTYVEWKHEATSNQVEWPTRVALSLPSPVELDVSRPVLDPELMQKLVDAAKSLHEHQRDLIGTEFFRRGRLAPNAMDHLVMRIRIQQLCLRTMAYPHQQRAWLERLFSPMASELCALLGFDIEDALDHSAKIMQLVDDRVRERFDSVHENKEGIREIARKKGAKGKEEEDHFIALASASWISTFMDEAFAIRADDLGTAPPAAHFLHQMSLGFGQPEPGRFGNTEDLLERPIVRAPSGRFICHIPLLTDAIRQNLEPH